MRLITIEKYTLNEWEPKHDAQALNYFLANKAWRT